MGGIRLQGMNGRTETEKLWLGGAAIGALLIAVVGWFFLISPQRDQTSSVEDQTNTAQLQNTTLEQHIASLASQNTKLKTYQSQLKAAQAALPQTSGASTFVRGMESSARATSTQLTTLTVGTATAWMPATTSSAAPTSSASSAPSSAATTGSTASTSAAGAGAGVYYMPITATVTGTNAQVNAYLDQLQSVQPRAVLITEITRGGQTPGATSTQKTVGGMTTLQLTMEMFVLPNAAAAPATPSTGG